MKYLDFDLDLKQAGDVFKARVVNSPAGQASCDFQLPFSTTELEEHLLKISRPPFELMRSDTPEWQAAKTIGGRLFESVFKEDLRLCFYRSLDEAGRQSVGLRIRLRLSDCWALNAMPWELLYDASTDRFLSLSTNTPVVRYLELPELIRPPHVKPPLRLLVMISSPTDYPRLEVDHEWHNLNQALRDLVGRGLVQIERLEAPTLVALQKRLPKGEYHIFHFIGHAGFDPVNQDGFIVLENEIGRSHNTDGRCLGTILNDEKTLQLAVLNACEGARCGQDPFSGTAQSLVRLGIPAVLAMQFKVTDDAAIRFAQEFYGALAEGIPIDAALAETRRTIYSNGRDLQWATPVLYMRSPDGHIFDIEAINRPHEDITKPATEMSPSKVPDTDELIFDRLYEAKVQLCLLTELSLLQPEHLGLNISALCHKLGIQHRKYAVKALRDLAAAGMIEKLKQDKKVTWRISEKGRGTVRRLDDLVQVRIENVAR